MPRLLVFPETRYESLPADHLCRTPQWGVTLIGVVDGVDAPEPLQDRLEIVDLGDIEHETVFHHVVPGRRDLGSDDAHPTFAQSARYVFQQAVAIVGLHLDLNPQRSL